MLTIDGSQIHDITTTSGETFTAQDSCDLAELIHFRFGRDDAAATRAWNRLLQNNCTESQFMTLVAGGLKVRRR